MKILVLGESFVDNYSFFKTKGKDPATKIPKVIFQDNKMAIGGAGNMVRNLHSLNNEIEIRFFTNFDFENYDNLLNDDIVVHAFDNHMPLKSRIYIDRNPIYRMDQLDEVKYSEEFIKEFISMIPEFDIVVVSDYHKGLISRDDLTRIGKACKKCKVLSFVDAKNFYEKYEFFDIVKINEQTARNFIGEPEEDPYEYCKIIAERFDIFRGNKIHVVVTHGNSGCSFFDPFRKVHKNIPLYEPNSDYKHNYIDTIGAGDAFLAGLIYGFGQFKNLQYLEDMIEIAQACAVEHCGYFGTLTTI